MIYPTQEQVDRLHAEYPSANAYSALGVHHDVLSQCKQRSDSSDQACLSSERSGVRRVWNVGVVGDLEPAARMEGIASMRGKRMVIGRYTHYTVGALCVCVCVCVRVLAHVCTVP